MDGYLYLRSIGEIAFVLIVWLAVAGLGRPLPDLEPGNPGKFTRQQTPLVRGNYEMEFFHIAKAAGRSIKYASDTMGLESPFRKCHRHSVKVSDVLKKNDNQTHQTHAVLVLRDPVDRLESAFTFLRSGGFGNRFNADHLLINYNSTDSFVEALVGGSIQAIGAARCDARLRFCAEEMANGEKFSLYKHATVELRPATWWLDVQPQRRVHIICYPDLHRVIPSLERTRSKEEILRSSRKGHWYIQRYITKDSNRVKVYKNLYPEDSMLYEQYCKG